MSGDNTNSEIPQTSQLKYNANFIVSPDKVDTDYLIVKLDDLDTSKVYIVPDPDNESNDRLVYKDGDRYRPFSIEVSILY